MVPPISLAISLSLSLQECVGSAAPSLESSIKWGDGFLIMYSITDRSSFESVSHLKRLIDHVKQTLGETAIMTSGNTRKGQSNRVWGGGHLIIVEVTSSKRQ